MENLDWKVLMYVPNIIGYARILLTLTSFVLLGLQLPGWFVIVYASAIILDGFDGYFARKLGQCSKFGAWLDVVIDNLGRSLLWAHVHPLASTVSALEWTVFVCNHQLGDDWRLRVAEGSERSSSCSDGALGGKGGVSKPCTANGTKSHNELQKDSSTAAEGCCVQRKYQDVHEGEYEQRAIIHFAEDCKENSSYREIVTHQEQSKSIATEASVTDLLSRCKVEREDNLKSDSQPHLVQWIMENNFRSVGGVWAIAGLHVLPLWLVGLRHGVFATSLHFLPSTLPVLGVVVLGAGRLLCSAAELWCVWVHVKALITATAEKSR